jgi:hypothetical protein
MPPELDRLIRLHECDNSVRFQDFARAVLRQDKQEFINSARSATPTPLNSVPPSPSSVSARAPFAAGGTWAVEARRSAAGSAPSENGSCPGGQAPLHTPWATGDVHPGPSSASRSGRSTPIASSSRPPSAPAGVRPSSTRGTRGYPQGDNADMLRWDTKETSSGSTPRQMRQSGQSRGAVRGSTPPPRWQGRAAGIDNNMADCLSWPDARGPVQDARLGKRFYAANAPASEILPQADTPFEHRNGPNSQQRGIFTPTYAAPYGTEADYGLKRPEDGGTAEYQPAFVENPRARRF